MVASFAARVGVDQSGEEELEEGDDGPEEVGEGREAPRLRLMHPSLRVDVRHGR